MECTCSIRHMEADGKQVLDYAQIDFCPLHSAAPDFLEAAKAAVAYDDVVRKRGADGEVSLDPGVAVAEGADLDTLYFDWINKARAAIAKAGA